MRCELFDGQVNVGVLSVAGPVQVLLRAGPVIPWWVCNVRQLQM